VCGFWWSERCSRARSRLADQGSPGVKELFCAPGNAGIAQIATCVPIESSSVVELADFAQKLNIALTVVGPELPLTSASPTSSGIAA